MGRLSGMSAVVTGGALGIGGGTARRLARDGADVLIVDVEEGAANANAERIRSAGGNAVAITGERGSGGGRPRDESNVQSPSSAGSTSLYRTPTGATATEQVAPWTFRRLAWREGMDLLTGALFLGAKYAVPAMDSSGGGGRIVNISSVHGLLMSPGSLVYEAGKSAVIGMTRQMACDFGPLGITVNAIAPGHIVTERSERMWKERGNAAGRRLFELQYPVRRTGVPDDIANAIAFLCSEEASFITGVVLPVDGGLSIQLQEDLVREIRRLHSRQPDPAHDLRRLRPSYYGATIPPTLDVGGMNRNR